MRGDAFLHKFHARDRRVIVDGRVGESEGGGAQQGRGEQNRRSANLAYALHRHHEVSLGS